jgi:hypothetical protein
VDVNSGMCGRVQPAWVKDDGAWVEGDPTELERDEERPRWTEVEHRAHNHLTIE